MTDNTWWNNPVCSNRNRSTRICRRSCCKKEALASNVNYHVSYITRSRTCSVCKGKIYVSKGQECLSASEGNTFDCIPSF